MIDRVIIDALNFKAKTLSSRWAKEIRKAPQLRHYNSLSDDVLMHLAESTFPQLAHFISDGLDRSVLGAYFVKMGKDGVKHGFPLSETVYGIRLCQKVVFDYMQSELVTDSSVALYQTLNVVPKIADFFVLGCFYLDKGFHEATFAEMREIDHISQEIFQKYFKDDFFFRKEEA